LALDWQQLPVDPALRADDVTIEAFLAIAAVVEGAVDTDRQSE
jgi:hypothetical protein